MVINISLSLFFIGCSSKLYNEEGFSPQGYDMYGYDKSGYDRSGYDRSEFGRNGYDRQGFNKNGYDEDGYDEEGISYKGYNIEGYDKNGYDEKGFNYNGYNIKGYDKYGFNDKGYTIKGYNRNGLNKNGLSKKIVEKRKINKLRSSPTTIVKIFNSTLKSLKKDKYESSLEYTSRIKNNDINTYFTMEVDIKGRYNPESKMYELVFSASNNLNGPFYKYKQGNPDSNFTFNPFSFQATSLIYQSKDNSWKDLGSNAYGYTTEVVRTHIKQYVIYPDNLSQIVDYNEYFDLKLIEDKSQVCARFTGSGELSEEKDKRDLTFLCNNKYDVILSIPISKKLAKKYDKQDFKLKISAKLIGINNSMYYNSSYSSATIDFPYSYAVASYISQAHIDTIVIYNKNTQKMLYQYID